MSANPANSTFPRFRRAIARRTRGRQHGPITRLMSPSDFGEILKPFVFLDFFDHEGPPFDGPLHPHSGIATLTYACAAETAGAVGASAVCCLWRYSIARSAA